MIHHVLGVVQVLLQLGDLLSDRFRLRPKQFSLTVLDASEHRLHGIVVLLRYRIEFMVMASRTAKR